MDRHVAVINWKGGCGKTTVALTLATAFAASGLKTTLADCDRQKTAMLWRELRPKGHAKVSVVDWRKDFGAMPQGTQRLIVDCPPSLRVKSVREIISECDVIVVPLLPSIFDETATVRFLDRLDKIKKVRKGKKPVLLVANRYRDGRKSSQRLEQFAQANELTLAARIPDRTLYTDLAERGLTVFDLTTKAAIEQQQAWIALMSRIEAQL